MRNNNNNENIPLNRNNNQDYNSFDRSNSQKEFSDELQKGFIKKVYTILSIQLIFVSCACAVTMLNKDVARFQKRNKEIFYVAMALSIILLLVITCVSKVARKVPLNYILLGIFTAC